MDDSERLMCLTGIVMGLLGLISECDTLEEVRERPEFENVMSLGLVLAEDRGVGPGGIAHGKGRG